MANTPRHVRTTNVSHIIVHNMFVCTLLCYLLKCCSLNNNSFCLGLKASVLLYESAIYLAATEIKGKAWTKANYS